ncbi:MAG: site-specific DNA-methyltransferase [Alphaproteobacteria bacterium]
MSRCDRHLEVGDNLLALGRLPDGAATLAYVDPPFNSGRAYEAVLFRERIKVQQDAAFNDKWVWTNEAEAELLQLRQMLSATRAAQIHSLIKSLGQTSSAAYLAMMAPRLVQIHRVLGDSGSLYVHCDPSASHYLRVLLDQIFGPENFRSEIIWRRTHAHSSSKRFGPIHDNLLFYTKSSKYTWTTVHTEYNPSYIANHFTHEDEKGRYQLITCTAPGDRQGTRAHYEWNGRLPPPGRHWAWQRSQMEQFEREGRLAHSTNGVPRLKRYITDGKGVPLQDVWLDISRLDARSDERIGFETQKPIKLLERIIAASSKSNDVVLDPFCGSGSTLVAAEGLGRRWIGIDSSLLACSLTLGRVRRLAGTKRIQLLGFPDSATRARLLRAAEPLTFGIWATGMLGTVPDRDLSDSRLITGVGTLRHKKQNIEVMSWVPLKGDTLINSSISDAKLLGRSIGFFVSADRDTPRLRQSIEQKWGVNLTDIDLDMLASPASHRQGFAASLS